MKSLKGIRRYGSAVLVCAVAVAALTGIVPASAMDAGIGYRNICSFDFNNYTSAEATPPGFNACFNYENDEGYITSESDGKGGYRAKIYTTRDGQDPIIGIQHLDNYSGTVGAEGTYTFNATTINNTSDATRLMQLRIGDNLVNLCSVYNGKLYFNSIDYVKDANGNIETDDKGNKKTAITQIPVTAVEAGAEYHLECVWDTENSAATIWINGVKFSYTEP
ncbi:MAG: hypothetical protein PUD92_09235 [Clostridiales bacterium]|nr:hypothetical protein [Clostridiales bacterium]